MMAITFMLLACAIVAVWWPPKKAPTGPPGWSALVLLPWLCVDVAAVATGVGTGVLKLPGLLALALLAAICLTAQGREGRPDASAWVWAAGLLSLALALHLVPGFHNPLLVNAARTSPDALPFTLYANFDKGSVGLFLLACFAPRLTSLRDARAIAWPTFAAVVGSAVVSIGVAWAAGYVRPEYKLDALPPFTLEFLGTNLFFTCVAEEAFFRGLIQERLARALAGRKQLVWLPPLVSALLFGLAHASSGVLYMGLATLAGAGYAWAYARTRRIEAAVLAHFAVNAVHFLFFSYPGLAK